MVDALVSGASGFAIVQVRVLFWALPKIEKMQSYTEDEIVVQLRDPARQREAFAKVVSLYGEKLYWHIRKMVLDHEDANDLLQNTFLKAWTNIELFRGEAKLSTWLYKIAINECITFLNKQRNMNNVSIDDADTFLLVSIFYCFFQNWRCVHHSSHGSSDQRGNSRQGSTPHLRPGGTAWHHAPGRSPGKGRRRRPGPGENFPQRRPLRLQAHGLRQVPFRADQAG